MKGMGNDLIREARERRALTQAQLAARRSEPQHPSPESGRVGPPGPKVWPSTKTPR